MYNHRYFFMIFALFSFQCTQTEEPISFHQQLNEQILKHVNVENPSKEDQELINTAHAFHNFGTPQELMNPENWHALVSVDMLGQILPKYNRTQTAFGYRMLQQQCSAGMTDDLSILNHRQELVKFFEQNPETVAKLSTIFEKSIPSEGKFLGLFKAIDASKPTPYYSAAWFKKFNESSVAMEVSTRLQSTLPMAFQVVTWLAAPIALNYMQDYSNNSRPYKIGTATINAFKNIKDTPRIQVDCFETAYGFSHNTAIGLVSLLTAIKIFDLYKTSKNAKELFDTIYEKQQELIEFSHLIKSLKILQRTIENNSNLQQLLAVEHAKLSELFDTNNTALSSDLKNLVQIMLSSSFQGTGSYLFSLQGKIVATHHILARIKGELIPYFEAFGQIDAYLSTAKLYVEFKNHPNATFCLPKFISSQQPQLLAHNFWHPFIDADKVVCNSLSMGHTKSSANLIITGPNAGGKTTSLTALIINIIFAQSFGIAPCKSLTITPFTKIHSYLDITTNLQSGLSLFAAEADRAKKLKSSILSCTPGQKTFTIIDELFTGTAESVASKIALQFANLLCEQAHSMTIITTHIAAMTQLEAQTARFENYKVADAKIDSAGNISYPFKLVKGISQQNIAEHMMKQQGIL